MLLYNEKIIKLLETNTYSTIVELRNLILNIFDDITFSKVRVKRLTSCSDYSHIEQVENKVRYTYIVNTALPKIIKVRKI